MNLKERRNFIDSLKVAREPNREDSPYRPWGPWHPEHPDYGKPGQPTKPPRLAQRDGMKITSAATIGEQVLQQRAEESKAGKIDRGSRSYIGEDHQRAREIDGEIYWYDEYKHMPFYQEILKKYGHIEELQQIQNEIQQQQQQSLKIGSPNLAKTPSQQNATNMLNLIKKLEREGKYIEAQQLYKEQFPRA